MRKARLYSRHTQEVRSEKPYDTSISLDGQLNKVDHVRCNVTADVLTRGLFARG